MVFRAAIAAFFLATLSACSQQLYGNLGETDANEIVSVLRNEGLAAEKRQATEKVWRVDVSGADFARAVSVMRTQNLPSQSFEGLGSVFKKDSLVSTEVEERARFTYALAQELQRTLSQMEGVVLARVHPVVVSNDQFTSKPKVASASVFIKHRADVDLTPRIQMIRELVANGIEGLPPERVSVALFRAEVKPASQTFVARRPELESMLLGAGALLCLIFAAGAVLALVLRVRGRSLRESASRVWNDTTQFPADALAGSKAS